MIKPKHVEEIDKLIPTAGRMATNATDIRKSAEPFGNTLEEEEFWNNRYHYYMDVLTKERGLRV